MFNRCPKRGQHKRRKEHGQKQSYCDASVPHQALSVNGKWRDVPAPPQRTESDSAW